MDGVTLGGMKWPFSSGGQQTCPSAALVAKQTPAPSSPHGFHPVPPCSSLNQALRDRICLLWLIDGSK